MEKPVHNLKRFSKEICEEAVKVSNGEPDVGKNVIEILTHGMYNNPLFVYREYIQNASDSIDIAINNRIINVGCGQIEVTVDHAQRVITFTDNGTGVPQNNIKEILGSIGDSPKDRFVDKGFRGIGRLGGLAYCNVVRFETSAKGESIKTIYEWDAVRLDEILKDKKDHSNAIEVMDRITNIHHEDHPEDDHFFKVSLIAVHNNHNELLDEEGVRRYLSMVAPVKFDYANFPLVKNIEQFLLNERLPSVPEYSISLNTDEIIKAYSNPLSISPAKGNTPPKFIEYKDTHCQVLRDSNGDKIGWLWAGLSKFDGVLPKSCWQRGLRIRKHNIQIGESDCLGKERPDGRLWEEERSNNYFIGEVHVLDKYLIPNSRRDYFETNESCRNFELVLGEALKELVKIYRNASKFRSIAQKAIQSSAENNSNKDEAIKKAKEKIDGIVKDTGEKHPSLGKSLGIVSDAIFSGPIHYLEPVKPKLPLPEPPPEVPAPPIIEPSVQNILNKVFTVLDIYLPESEASKIKNEINLRFTQR